MTSKVQSTREKADVPFAFHEPTRPLAFLEGAYPALSIEDFDRLLQVIDEAEKTDFPR